MKKAHGLGSGRGRPGREVCGWEGTLFPEPGDSKARTNFIKYKTRRGWASGQREKVKYNILGLAIIKNKVIIYKQFLVLVSVQ